MEDGLITPLGHVEFMVMPFGITSVPAVFKTHKDKLHKEFLSDMLKRFIFVYLDEILISNSFEEHVQHIRLVLQGLSENRLFEK